MTATLLDALALLGNFDHRLLDIVSLSLRVSLSALLLGTLTGLPLGAGLAVANFRGRGTLIVVLNALMGLLPWTATITADRMVFDGKDLLTISARQRRRIHTAGL